MSDETLTRDEQRALLLVRLERAARLALEADGTDWRARYATDVLELVRLARAFRDELEAVYLARD